MRTHARRLFLAAFLLAFCHTASAFYDPNVGRWISRDPIGEEGGNALYVALNNAPADRIDPLGLKISQVVSVNYGTHDGGDLGSTDPNWPSQVATREQKKVTITGSLSIKVTFTQGVNPDSLVTDNGQTLRQHENTHRDILKRWWSDLARSVDPTEGDYCSASCAQIAADASNTISAHNLWSSEVENVGFDIAVYGHRKPSLFGRQADAKRQVEQLRERLNALERQWTAKKCTKSQGSP
jgi:uncharacterized protein RhaS with RHS repeats